RQAAGAVWHQRGELGQAQAEDHAGRRRAQEQRDRRWPDALPGNRRDAGDENGAGQADDEGSPPVRLSCQRADVPIGFWRIHVRWDLVTTGASLPSSTWYPAIRVRREGAYCLSVTHIRSIGSSPTLPDWCCSLSRMA